MSRTFRTGTCGQGGDQKNLDFCCADGGGSQKKKRFFRLFGNFKFFKNLFWSKFEIFMCEISASGVMFLCCKRGLENWLRQTKIIRTGCYPM